MIDSQYRRIVEREALTAALDPDLVEGLILTESTGHADAFRWEPKFWQRYLAHADLYKREVPRRVSSSYGLCQIMLPTAREHGFAAEPEYLFLPDVNVHLGCTIIARLLKWAGNDTRKALGAYNAGRGGWDSEAGRAYAAKVLANTERVKAERRTT